MLIYIWLIIILITIAVLVFLKLSGIVPGSATKSNSGIDAGLTPPPFQNIGPDSNFPNLFQKYESNIYTLGGVTNPDLTFNPTLYSLDNTTFLDTHAGSTNIGVCFFPDQVVAKRVREICESDDPVKCSGLKLGETRERYIVDNTVPACGNLNSNVIYGPIVLGSGNVCLKAEETGLVHGATCDLSDTGQLWLTNNGLSLAGLTSGNGPLVQIQTREDFGLAGSGLTGAPGCLGVSGSNLILTTCPDPKKFPFMWLMAPRLNIKVSNTFVPVPEQLTFIPDATGFIQSLPTLDISNFSDFNSMQLNENNGIESVSMTPFFVPTKPGDTNVNKTSRFYDYRLYNTIRKFPEKFPI